MEERLYHGWSNWRQWPGIVFEEVAQLLRLLQGASLPSVVGARKYPDPAQRVFLNEVFFNAEIKQGPEVAMAGVAGCR